MRNAGWAGRGALPRIVFPTVGSLPHVESDCDSASYPTAGATASARASYLSVVAQTACAPDRQHQNTEDIYPNQRTKTRKTSQVSRLPRKDPSLEDGAARR